MLFCFGDGGFTLISKGIIFKGIFLCGESLFIFV